MVAWKPGLPGPNGSLHTLQEENCKYCNQQSHRIIPAESCRKINAQICIGSLEISGSSSWADFTKTRGIDSRTKITSTFMKHKVCPCSLKNSYMPHHPTGVCSCGRQYRLHIRDLLGRKITVSEMLPSLTKAEENIKLDNVPMWTLSYLFILSSI